MVHRGRYGGVSRRDAAPAQTALRRLRRGRIGRSFRDRVIVGLVEQLQGIGGADNRLIEPRGPVRVVDHDRPVAALPRASSMRGMSRRPGDPPLPPGLAHAPRRRSSGHARHACSSPSCSRSRQRDVAAVVQVFEVGETVHLAHRACDGRLGIEPSESAVCRRASVSSRDSYRDDRASRRASALELPCARSCR